MIIAVACITLALVSLSTYFLLPLPLLSYPQGGLEDDRGKVTKIESIRPGVIEVSLTSGLTIDPLLPDKHVLRIVGATITRYFHFRKGQKLPQVGDNILTSSINRNHRFTGRSFNWVKKWEQQEGEAPAGGKLMPESSKAS